jgi:hypothetical protein
MESTGTELDWIEERPGLALRRQGKGSWHVTLCYECHESPFSIDGPGPGEFSTTDIWSEMNGAGTDPSLCLIWKRTTSQHTALHDGT